MFLVLNNNSSITRSFDKAKSSVLWLQASRPVGPVSILMNSNTAFYFYYVESCFPTNEILGTWSCIWRPNKLLTLFLYHKRLTGESSVLPVTTWHPEPRIITRRVRGQNLTSNTETIRRKKGHLRASEGLELLYG